MAKIELAPEISDDFDRIVDHLLEHEVIEATVRIDEIVSAISVLENNPHIGRPTTEDLRELIIGQHSKGYVALYRFVAELDTVFVLAIRAQKEAGYK